MLIIPIPSLRAKAISSWEWTCDRLSNIRSKSTLVIAGTHDIIRPPANSIMLAEKIPRAWLVQLKGGGYEVMSQYPEEFTAVLETFLSNQLIDTSKYRIVFAFSSGVQVISSNA